MSQTERTICDYVLDFPKRGDALAIQYKHGDHWHKVSWSEYYKAIEAAGFGLIELGVKPGDTVALMSNTRYEWAMADHAILGVRAITVPIYQTATTEEVVYILNHCEAKFLILENEVLFQRVATALQTCPNLKEVILIEKSGTGTVAVHDWREILARGDHARDKNPKAFRDLAASVKLKDIASIIYTSGTTGLPKGVVLEHQQVISSVENTYGHVFATPQDTSMPFLPFAHVFGRVEHWGATYIGNPMAFAESIDKLRGNMAEVRPNFLLSVPRIYEKIYNAVLSQVRTNPTREKIFKWALAVGINVVERRLRGEAIPIGLQFQNAIGRKLALNKVKALFGGQIRFTISGGAPISREIALFLNACDVKVLEGYGLTETTAVAAVNTIAQSRIGTVGKPGPTVQVKIADDGEILVRGNCVMREYYKDPVSNAAAFKDGWFCTGDIGEFDRDGFLKITDRKKDLIKTAGGKYIAPQKLEGALKVYAPISNALIHGDRRPYVVALLTLDRVGLLAFAREKGLPDSDYVALTKHPAVVEYVTGLVARANAGLAQYESIKKFAILPNELSVEAGELTPSLKTKRKFLDEKFRAEIDALYADARE